MMGIADDFAAGPTRAERKPNGLRIWLAGLDAEDNAAALAMLTDSSWKTRGVFESFTRNGLAMSFSHFDRLRKDRSWE